MKRKYLAFDIETAAEVPGPDFNWRPHRPLGITCAAALPTDGEEAIVWQGSTTRGTPAKRMSTDEVARLVARLAELVADGYTLLTWNGLGFDFDILAEESGSLAPCRQLALNHVDMMFHVFCDRGFPVALDKAALGLGIPGKPPGMSGLLAPQLWAQGRHQEVVDYVKQDVRITLQVAETCERERRFRWMTRKGSTSTMDLKRGWLNVKEALLLPEPDTSWMSSPIAKSQFTQWLTSPAVARGDGTDQPNPSK